MKGKSRSVRRVKHNATYTQRNNTHSAELNTELCRLCHGRFSTQKLQQVFGPEPSSPEPSAAPPPFSADFQQLVGVAVLQDSTLSAFICTDCHAQFYQCNNILQNFKHCVNTIPLHNTNTERSRSKAAHTQHPDPAVAPPITPDRRGLLRLVWWAHEHAGGCSSRPGLREVLEGGCGGAVRAVWSCADGHAYLMDSTSNCKTDQDIASSTHQVEPQATRNPAHTNKAKTQSSAHRYTPTETSYGAAGEHEASSPVQLLEDSDLSDRNFSTDDDDDEMKNANAQTDTRSKKSGKDMTNPEPKQRKKPGPKPGWKKKLRTEREDLPTIYKCPHQGCTAVYRGVDGMRKHVKEHHEEVRERPCPHPGCNKVFMIDRYLQRHVKLIHTEVRNYICDQCGQTFKQRKHLSVHQMRHSGAKPLQCEVCGFQCRQRASLKYHMTKHKAEAELEFACSVCERRFEKAHNLNVHMSMMHPLLQDNTHTDSHTRTPWRCEQAGCKQ